MQESPGWMGGSCQLGWNILGWWRGHWTARGCLGLTLGQWGILGDEVWVFGTEVLGAGVMDRSISGGEVTHTISMGQMVSRDAWTGEAVSLCFGCAWAGVKDGCS